MTDITDFVRPIAYSVDEVGKVFLYEGKILRAINWSSLEYIDSLLSSGLIQELAEKKYFPRTCKTSYIISDYSLVLEHEYIPDWNYAYEWTYHMLRDAADLVITVNQIANKYGYELYDCHASNVTMTADGPIYVDIGSFKKQSGSTSWKGKKIFNACYLAPLDLYARGYRDVSRHIHLSVEYFSEIEYFLLRYPLLKLIGYKPTKIVTELNNKLDKLLELTEDEIETKLVNRTVVLKLAKNIKKLFRWKCYDSYKALTALNKLSAPAFETYWENYQNKVNPADSARYEKIVEIINAYDEINSVLEIAANQGKLSSYILEKCNIDRVIATDYDIGAIDLLYKTKPNDSRLLPLLVNFFKPEGRIFDKKIVERVNGDVVIVMALTHHLFLTQNYDIDYVFRTVSALSKQYVIIEFMPLGLYSGDDKLTPPLPDYYNLEWFKNGFCRHYEYLLDEELEKNRHVFVGRIKKVSV